MHKMFRQSMVILIPLILLVPYAAYAQYSSKIALSTDKTVYTIGMKVTAAGQVLGSFDPTSAVSISVRGSAGVLYHSGNVVLDDSGSFTYQFVLDDNARIGTYILEATHQNNQGEIRGSISFEVRNRASVNVETDKTTYNPGDNVIIHGRVSPILPDSQVLIQVFNPRNSAWTFKSVSSSIISPTGQFSVDLGKLDGKSSLHGVYTVKVSYAGSTAIYTTSFVVGSDSSQSDIPSKVVVSVQTAPILTASVAQETVIEYEIRNAENEEQEFTYFVLIKDSEGLTVSLSWVKGKIYPAQTVNMEQSWKPESEGIYTVELFVWKSIENPEALSPVIVRHILVE
ncbi:MAG: hypothetical protein QXU32_07745 [Nitrososphaerales archaeon]